MIPSPKLWAPRLGLPSPPRGDRGVGLVVGSGAAGVQGKARDSSAGTSLATEAAGNVKDPPLQPSSKSGRSSVRQEGPCATLPCEGR
jgi:hypothetical protein